MATSSRPGTPADVAPATPTEDTPAPQSARHSRRRRAALAALAGLLVGLGATEAVFRARDHGAFPLVNVYERDEARGVRLRPGATTRVGRRGGRVTGVRVNRNGFRGADWPPSSKDEVLIVGDSQSFGLGVEEDEALAARLRAALGGDAVVLDASVPTYGPPEYLATLRTLLPLRTPRAVVVAINLLNDFSELARPNTERHTALDGWAVRTELSPARLPSSPLRELLIGRSHAAFAAWRWWRMREAALDEPTPEPSWEELVDTVSSSREAARAGDARRDEATRHSIADAEGELTRSRGRIVELVRKYTPLFAYAGATTKEWDAYLRADGEPTEQIFELSYGGCGPPTRGLSSFRSRFPGSRIREDVESRLQELAASSTLPHAAADDIREAFAAREAARARLGELRNASPSSPTVPRPALPMVAMLEELRALVPGRLVVLAVPLDVQISRAARAEKGVTDADVSALDAMVQSLVAEARALGADAVDPTAALARAGELAFQPDGHLAPDGHAAVAGAVAEALAAPR